jgi:hypothetical protein
MMSRMVVLSLALLVPALVAGACAERQDDRTTAAADQPSKPTCPQRRPLAQPDFAHSYVQNGTLLTTLRQRC